jgi:DNA-binding PadR family transcriptional regulator
LPDNELNATQASLLGFLHDNPRTGWELLQEVQRGLQRFWNVTSSHVYRELRTLEARGLIEAGSPGPRDSRPFAITTSGRRAFREWIEREPGAEQIRFPLLVTLWFGRHLDPDTLHDFLQAQEAEHTARLAAYRATRKQVSDDPYVSAVVGFGIEYERAVLRWLASLPFDGVTR